MRTRMVKGKWAETAILAIGLAALLLFTACAPAPAVPTEEQKTVEFGAIVPLTGGASAQIQFMMSAVQNYLKDFNEQQEIPGVSIELLWADSALESAKFYSHYYNFAERHIPVLWAMETPKITGYKDRFAEDEMVVIGSAGTIQDLVYSPGWCYFQAPTASEYFAVVADYLMENWKETRPPRITFMLNETLWSTDMELEGKKYAEALGFEVLPSHIFPFVVLDATPQLLSTKDDAPDFVYVQLLTASQVPLLRDAERLGLVDQMRFVGTANAMSDNVIQMAGTAMEGYLMSMITPWFDETEVPGVQLMMDQEMKYYGKVVRDNTYRNGYIVGAVTCEAIKRAIENVGYENLNGLAIKQVLDDMEDFDIDGLASITYKDRPFDHRGITRLALYEVTGGEVVRVSDWREAPSLVPEGLIRE